MYPHKYIIPKNYNTMYRNSQLYPESDERFFLTPFLVGGLAGTALGYGIANNNQLNNNNCCGNFYPVPMPVPIYQMPYSQTNFAPTPNYSVQSTSPSSFSNFGNNNFY